MMSTVNYPVPKAALMTKPGVKPVPLPKKAEEAPIFLQKTYHMIDTCDPKVCCWSEDGKTFIVKNITAFEKDIIPQFFKHNKFSSFVRQLNFYGFRKIKYSDSLRIDPKMEAQTAHFWRFKHDNFVRGRKDLLVQIKRSVGGISGAAATSTMAPVPPKVTPATTFSSAIKPIANKPEEVTHLKSEVQELKQRIASMTKNIDDLTSLVKNISVKDEEAPVEQAAPGQKRKKIKADDTIEPDWTGSLDPFPALLSEVPLPDVASSSEIMPVPSSSVSDDAFVDELFEVFANEDGEFLSMSSLDDVPSSRSESPNPNKPDPHLMKRIEDSLSTIPKDMHEMVADRLIDAIANTQPIAKSAQDLFSSEQSAENMSDCRNEKQESNAVSLSMAVATLRTILAEYGVSVECHRQCKDQEGRLAKSLPVVPMHA